MNRIVLLENWLAADHRDAFERFAALRPRRLEPPGGNISEGPAIALAAALLEVDQASIAAMKTASAAVRDEGTDAWSSDLRSSFTGDLTVHHEVRHVEPTSRRAGVVWIESRFDDNAFHPRVGAGGGSVVLRVYDLEAGWGVVLELYRAEMAFAADAAHAKRIEKLARYHLAYTTRHFSGWDRRDRDDDDEIEAFVRVAAARLDPSAAGPPSLVTTTTQDRNLRITAHAGRGSVAVTYQRGNETDLGLAFVEITATPGTIDAIGSEFTAMLGFEGIRDDAWVEHQASLMRQSFARASRSATERAKAILEVQPDQPDAALVMAMALVSHEPLDAMREPERWGYEAEFVRGMVCLLGHDYRTALGHFEAAVDMRPGDAAANHYAGVALTSMARRDGSVRRGDAEARFRAALAGDPDPGALRIDTRPGFAVRDIRADARAALERLRDGS